MLAAVFAVGAMPPSGSAAPTVAPYGAWRSPITSQMLVQGAIRFGDLCLDGGTLYWTESRPQEQGRNAIVRRTPDGAIDDVLPPPFSARTLVHEYGGGTMLATGGVVYFTNYADQRLWRLEPGAGPEPITAEGKLRFADFVHDSGCNRLIAVCEDHTAEGKEPANRIVAVDLASGAVTTLVEGADFYATPRVSPDGRQLAWLSWNHPNMPWDDSELHVATFDGSGSLGPPRRVAGEPDESVFQPAWSPDGALYFVSDRTDWWNLYAERDGQVAPVLPMEAEFGVPQWVFGAATYGVEPDGHQVDHQEGGWGGAQRPPSETGGSPSARPQPPDGVGGAKHALAARFTRGGKWEVVRIDPQSGATQPLELPYSNVAGIAVGRGIAFVVAGAPTVPETLVAIDLASGRVTTIRASSPIEVDPGYTSVPEAIEFPTDGGKTAHAFFYPPTNRDFRGPAGEAPPLLVMIHGGPTSATAAQFRLTTQYWTSRGFAVCDVNYGGSTGYGRAYRNRLRGAWGVVDVADAANAAKFLAQAGKVDPAKLMIRGGSAGGYTTLACLTFRSEFFAGASHYGISDLAIMAADTHKFESRYLDQLVGLYPQDEKIYRERSPIYHLESFNRPVILLQGLEDKIVPPNQAEMILESLKKKGVPVAYVPFEGEQHGFRKAENIMRAHETELYFYSRVLGFDLPERVEPVEIFNLAARQSR